MNWTIITKFFSRKFILALLGPFAANYMMVHNWPPAVIAWVMGLLGTGVVAQAAVDAVTANRGVTSNNVPLGANRPK